VPETPDETTHDQPTRAARRAARRRRRGGRPGPLVLLAGLLVVALVGAGVWVLNRDTATASPDTVPTSAVGDRVEDGGGTLHALALGPVGAWDPQRIATREDMAFAGRIFARTLTAYAPSTDPGEQSTLVGDLATDTGTPSDDLRTWTFTLRDDVKWQDGSTVTCEDVAYGISRTFATDDITGGPTDALAVLDIPRDEDGTSSYPGPYATGDEAEKGQEAFDKAVACDGRQLTFTLSRGLSDFNEMVSQPAFGPFKETEDRGADSAYDVFSAGPYVLEGGWETGRGGTFVRNPNWSPDSDPVRDAFPDEIDYQEGLDSQAVAQQIMADNDTGRVSVSLGSVPPAIQQHITAVQSLDERSLNPLTGLVDYLVPNTESEVFGNEKARLALSAATNREAYVTAIGGPTAAEPSHSLIPRSLPAAHDEDPIGSGDRGDVATARRLLEESGLEGPVEFTVAYRSTPTSDKAIAALVAGWRQAGFDPTPEPITDDYFGTISSPDAGKEYDVFWSNWAPAWASASTVLVPLFDSSINLTDAGPGRDYGYWKDEELNSRMSEAEGMVDGTAREKEWAAIDSDLLSRGAYIGLAERRGLYIAGSDVRNLSANAVLGGVVEFADIAVAR
jgi:peptide/nickel transport system substrate-binding protein